MRRIVLATLIACSVPLAAPAQNPPRPAGGKPVSEDAKIAVVRQMIDAWDTMDWQRVEDLFAEDGVLHSMMIDPVVGRAQIGARIKALGAGATKMRLNVRNIGVVGDVVMVERVDEFTYKGHEGKVPVVGVLQVEGGRIKEWREYYDRAQLLKEMGVSQDFH